jgi:hypothetical protein
MTKLILPPHRALLYQPRCLRREIRALLTRYQFPEATFKQVEDILVRQIRISRISNRAVPATRFKNAQDALTHFDVGRFVWPKGRGRADQRLKRTHLFATLFRVWVIAFGEVPTINNKGFARTPFVQFAHLILRHEGIGKLETHLESYQSDRKRALQTLVAQAPR